MKVLFMNAGQARVRWVQAGAALLAAALIAGCGSAYQSSVTPINTTGPASDVLSLTMVVSAPSAKTNGVMTVVDYSGDTVMDQVQIGVAPTMVALDLTGVTAFTYHADGTLDDFALSSTLQAKSINHPALPAGANLSGLFDGVSGLWASDLATDSVQVFNYSYSWKLQVPVATTPIAIVGPPSSVAQRNYAISQNISGATGAECNLSPTTVSTNGLATPIETASLTADATIPLGKCPVYALPSPDGRRIYVLNRGSDTVSVIDTTTNAIDGRYDASGNCTPYTSQSGKTVTCHPALPLSTTAVTNTGITPVNGTTGMTATAGPVYAEYNSSTSQLVVSNYDGSTISIIDVSLDEYGNDSPTFGTTYTVAVGQNPAAVTVLYDGSRAYTANQTDGTVSIVNLSSHTVEKVLSVVGHPRTVASTQNGTKGKVYVASPDTDYLTVLATINDEVDTTILLEGDVVDVRVATRAGTSQSNDILTSRKPGYGQPCNLPPALMTSAYGTNYTLANCTTQP